jgi:2-aminoethylphosphonate transport system substrate-binding protein
MKRALAALILTALSGMAAADPERVVNVYSAPGLHDGKGSWYEKEFAAFTKATGVEVRYIQAGAGVIVDRAAKEKALVDVLITLPPSIQKAQAECLLQAYTPKAAAEVDGGGPYYQPIANNYLSFIYNASALKTAPGGYDDLLDPKFRRKLQYSTPGEAGDGTAVMLQVFHVFGGREAGFQYLSRLQANNVGPSPATGPLTPLVNNATLYVANGDLQMNLQQLADNPNIRIFWPAGPAGERSALSMPYYAGLGAEAPHPDHAKALIEFLLSKEAQQEVGGAPVRKDVTRADAAYGTFRDAMKGVAAWTPDWAQVLKDMPADVARWHKITGT